MIMKNGYAAEAKKPLKLLIGQLGNILAVRLLKHIYVQADQLL